MSLVLLVAPQLLTLCGDLDYYQCKKFSGRFDGLLTIIAITSIPYVANIPNVTVFMTNFKLLCIDTTYSPAVCSYSHALSFQAIVVVPDLYRGRPWTGGIAAKFDSVRTHRYSFEESTDYFLVIIENH